MTPKSKTSSLTIAATNGIAQWDRYGAVVPPLQLSSTYAFAGYDKTTGYDYSRSANPNRDLLADTLAKLESGCGGVITSSGMAAVDLALSLARRGQTVIAPKDCYGGTWRLLAERHARGDFAVRFIDMDDLAQLRDAVSSGAALVFVETPSNPLMRISDLHAICEIAHAAGAKVVADNTFLSPAFQNPITLGADIVVHSTTKFINGHSDVVGGAVICANPEDLDPLAYWANTIGCIGAPFDAYMTLRGLRTLFVRTRQQAENAMAVATYLAGLSAVSAVHYPGLASHPGHALAATQQTGFGAMLSFELAGGLDAVRRFVGAVEVFTLAESLGGVESLVAHPATMTHAAMGADARKAAGIGDGLLRLSVGLESVDDMIAGLQTGFAAIAG